MKKMNESKVNAMRKGKILLVIMALLLSLFLISSACALGITPGRATFNFNASDEKQVSLSIVNTEHKEMKVLVQVEGEWAKYVTLNQTEIAFNKTEEIKTLRYNVKFPSDGGFDGIKARIIAMEIPLPSNSNQGTSVGAKIAVEHQLYIITGAIAKNLTQNSTVTEKINVTKIYIKNYTRGEIAKIEIEIFNPTTRTMENIYSTILIYDSYGILRNQFNSTVQNIDAKKNATLVAMWNTYGFEIGDYGGELFVYYDNETIKRDLKIRVEENYISIEFGKLEYQGIMPLPEIKKKEENKLSVIILIIVIVIFIIADIILFIRLRRKNLENTK